MSENTRITPVTGSVQLAHWVEEMAPGWRCVWLPQHCEFLAFMDVAMPDGEAQPSARGATADRVLSEIRAHAGLRAAIREYLAVRGSEAGA